MVLLPVSGSNTVGGSGNGTLDGTVDSLLDCSVVLLVDNCSVDGAVHNNSMDIDLVDGSVDGLVNDSVDGSLFVFL